jgi:hypothetical protein
LKKELPKIVWALLNPEGLSDVTETWVLPWLSSSTPPTLSPRSTKNVARVTMKLGSFVRTTMIPLSSPMKVANTSVPPIASHVFQWYLPTSNAITIAVTPDITPVERSNSPPIISSPTGTARIPKNAAC